MPDALDPDTAARLHAIYSRALRVLSEADPIVWGELKGQGGSDWAGVQGDVAIDLQMRLLWPLVEQHPSLDPALARSWRDTAAERDARVAAEPAVAEEADEPLDTGQEVMSQLASYRSADKLQHLPGVDVRAERARLAAVLDDLAERLLRGLREHPHKRWVMAQFEQSLRLVEHEDTEAKEHFGLELEWLMDLLGIESSDGLLSDYLGGI